MNEKLELSLKSIKTLEDEKTLLEEKIKQEREKVFSFLEEENLGQYKSDIATVSYVERKSIKMDKEKTLEKVLEMDIVKYIDVVPEHKELSKTFDKDIKDGILEIEGVEVEVKKLPMIRFLK
jgi:hypothetical protein